MQRPQKKKEKGKTSSNGGLWLALAYMQTTKPARDSNPKLSVFMTISWIDPN